MNILIVYGSIEGQTRKIATKCQEQLVSSGHNVRLVDAFQPVSDVVTANFSACLIAAPVHQQRHPDEVINFVRAQREALRGLPTAFISVSLAAAFAEGREDAKSYIARFLERTGLQPAATHMAAGALRYKAYDFFQEQIIRPVVLKDRSTDLSVGDQEFTDWQRLEDFVAGFVANLDVSDQRT
jgi:menaquinone-dependent protoporphyrinogen oxidase